MTEQGERQPLGIVQNLTEYNRSGRRNMDKPAPDLYEPLLAFRHWKLTSSGLKSPISEGFPWSEGPNTARCKARMHPAGTQGCQCGFYCVWDPMNGEYAGRRDFPHVTGVVAIWGRVTIGDKGARAEKAQVMALCVPSKDEQSIRFLPSRAKRLKRQYRSVRLFRDFDNMVNTMKVERPTALINYTDHYNFG